MSRRTVFCVLVALALLLSVGATMASAAPTAQQELTYTVKLGDNLWRLADKYLGSGTAWPAIMATTNQENIEDTTFAYITNADIIHPGWKLAIPSAEDAEAFLAAYDPAKPEMLFGQRAKGQLVVGS